MLALALPALGALVAEPVLLLTDAAIIGRTGGADALAGLAAGGAVLTAVVGACVFLAYATTAAVSRLLGAGDLRGALAQGVDGAWLALALGVPLAALGWWAAPEVVRALDTPAAAVPEAVAYLRWSLPGLPSMLVVLAGTGVLRGLQDTRTTLVVAVGGAAANLVLDVVLVVGLDRGLAGAGLGTSLAQTAMALVLAAVVVRGARRHGVALRPRWAGMRRSGRAGAPLLVRTLCLRAALLVTTAVAGHLGVVALASHQLALSVWSLLALALDAVAIAAQALVGRALGASDLDGARALLRALVRWGVGAGAVFGALVLAAAPWLPRIFTTDPGVRDATAAVLVVVALSQPLAGWVFVLDGVLMGAGDGRYLAAASAVTLAVYAPLAVLVQLRGPEGAAGLLWLWVAFAGAFMAARAVTLGLRARGTRWTVLGATR